MKVLIYTAQHLGKLGRFGTGPKAIQYRTGEIAFMALIWVQPIPGFTESPGISRLRFPTTIVVMEVYVKKAIDDALQDSALKVSLSFTPIQ
jgi:hypothetical protein